MKLNEAVEKEYEEAHKEVIRLWMEFENAKQRLELAEKACLEAQGQQIIEICFGENSLSISYISFGISSVLISFRTINISRLFSSLSFNIIPTPN